MNNAIIQTKQKTYTVKEFLQIEDIDFKKYLYCAGLVNTNMETEKVETDEKIMYLQRKTLVRCNPYGTFYKKSDLTEWIIYNKKDKKVKISMNNYMVLTMLLKEKFHDEDFVRTLLPKKMTKTLAKRIIENKINCIEDILKYYKSYIVRDASISLETIYKFLICDRIYMTSCISDPENVNPHDLSDATFPNQLMEARVFKYSSEDIKNKKIWEKYESWFKEQDKKYGSLSGS